MRKPTVTGVAESDHAAPASAPVSRLVESGPTTRAAGAGDHPEGQEPGAYRRTISPTGRDRARPLIGRSARIAGDPGERSRPQRGRCGRSESQPAQRAAYPATQSLTNGGIRAPPGLALH